ncbi:site-specific integrase [Adlercreutzia sp. ZJ473]|uniref:site-specific integrase n=1 Tax=Adlercreutzia sp. ZJ473 TaxID=2722822 RepID=UPI0015551019|nr:site-specific integrase [Adlercreutzia sp. ZJ473]
MPAYQLDNDRWTAAFYYRDHNGALKRKYKRGFETEADALAYEEHFKELEGTPARMSFREMAESYLHDVKPRIRWSTYDTKAQMIRTKIIPFFDEKMASEITPLDIIRWQGWLDSLLQRNGKPYSATYIRQLNSQAAAIFNFAEEHYGIAPNPMRKVKKTGSAKSHEMQIWTKDEFYRFLEAVSDKDLSFYAFELLYWAGIREGELLALTPSDFNFAAGTLAINKAFAKKGKESIIGPPKTKKSYRTIAMPGFLAREMKEFLENADIAPDERIFKLTKQYLWREMERGCGKSGVKRIRVHDLRHSHVSMLIHMGFSAVAIGARMGHESQDITFRYAHLFPNEQENMADSLQEIGEMRR